MTQDTAGYVATWLWAASAVFVGFYAALWVNRRDVKRDAEAMERRAAQLAGELERPTVLHPDGTPRPNRGTR